MKYCTNCLQPNTRPNSRFTDAGICPACHYFGEIKDVDWEERFEILKDLLKTFPRSPGQFFDCIIGVSGGKDSTRQALWARDKLGLRPLLVCLGYPPEQVTQRGTDNLSNLIDLGFDVVISQLAPGVWRRVMREGFFSFTNWARGTEQAIVSAVPQLAIKYNIPLVFWGENPWYQLCDLKTVGKTGYDGNNLKYMNTVSGGSLDWLLKAGFKISELSPYLFPISEQFDAAGIQIVYMGWFWSDWSLVNNAKYSTSNGLTIREDKVENTGDLLGVTSLDEDWVTLNQMIKYYKYGFGRVSDYANEEIRLGRITRNQGIALVEQYDDSCSSEYIDGFCSYLEITKQRFWEQVHTNLNKNLFTIRDDGKIERKFKVGVGL